MQAQEFVIAEEDIAGHRTERDTHEEQPRDPERPRNREIEIDPFQSRVGFLRRRDRGSKSAEKANKSSCKREIVGVIRGPPPYRVLKKVHEVRTALGGVPQG